MDGKKLFMKHCDQCHPRGESGLAPAINNKPLPAFLIRFQVRHGLGAMPKFSQDVITDQELEQVITYLQALRHHF
jgi:mono/diheme cytochrome c family protein